MTYALMSSGGKSATLALDHARRENLDVEYLVTIYTGTPTRVRFHGNPQALIEQQAWNLGLEPIAIRTTEEDLETAFEYSLEELTKLNVTGVIFGDISLESVRSWYEERINKAGLEHIEPNWGDPSIEIAWEVVERGYQAVVVSVNRAKRATKYLGRELDADMVTEIGCTDGIDPCGELGEYHTFVFDGPAFGRPLNFTAGGEFESEGHRLIEMILPTP